MSRYEELLFETLNSKVNKIVENQALILFLLNETTHHAFNDMVESQLADTQKLFCIDRAEKKTELTADEILAKLFGGGF